MKTTIISLTVLSLTLSAFMTNTASLEKRKAIASSDEMAERVVHAFRKSSSNEYLSLFPSANEFTEMMQESAEIYGAYLADAQHEFAQNYKTSLLPAVKSSFEQIVKEGEEQGIDWSSVRYISTEVSEQPTDKFSPVPVVITFASKGIEHKIIMNRALVIHGHWKVSQFIKLI